MSIADMFLKMAGVTGESSDADMKGQMDIVSWNWGMESPTDQYTGQAAGRVRVGEVHVVKRVDRASPTLMTFQVNNKEIDSATLIVRKAGTTPLTYVQVDMRKVRIVSLQVATEGVELIERMALRATAITVTYTPQGITGAVGGGANIFDWAWNGGGSQ